MGDFDSESAEIRRRFGEQVPILDGFPKASEVLEKESWLERITGTVSLEKWMWKSKRGLLIAIIVVPPAVAGLIDFWPRAIVTGYEYAKPYVEILRDSALTAGDQFIAFLPDPTGTGLGDDAERPAVLAPSLGAGLQLASGTSYLDAVLYRIASPSYSPLDGAGAARVGGRWHSPGVPVLYTSDTILAALGELQRMAGSIPRDFVLHEIRVRGTATLLPPDLVAEGARSLDITRKFGDAWLAEGATDLLIAPSPMDPAAHTVVVNLAHRDRMTIELARTTRINSGAMA